VKNWQQLLVFVLPLWVDFYGLKAGIFLYIAFLIGTEKPGFLKKPGFWTSSSN
jgi:hypothetical protein